MPNETYDGVTMQVRRNEDQGLYQLGALVNGVFVVFAARKLGGVDDDLARAAEAAAQPAAPPEQ